MKNTTIRKVFGAQQKLQGSVGLVISLLEGLTNYNWESAWPGIQRAMIGLGVTAIAAVKSEAIRRGLSDLAERIAAFQPTASPMPGESLTPEIPLPYIPLSPAEKTIDRPAFFESLIHEAGEVITRSQNISTSPQRPPDCDDLGDNMERLLDMKDKVTRSYDFWGAAGNIAKSTLTRDLNEEIRKTQDLMNSLWCENR